MSEMFNTLLLDAGYELSDVRLLRHKDNRAAKGRSLYELWRKNPPQFLLYQSIQAFESERKLAVPYWASFIGTPDNETLFVGIYKVLGCRELDHDSPKPHTDGIDRAGTRNIYELALEPGLSNLIDRLVIDWGPAKRIWIQRPDRQNKLVVEMP